MSTNQIQTNETNTNVLEGSLKDILDKMLTYFEKFIKTKEDLASIEEKLNDYENISELVEIIKSVFSCLTEKIDERMQGGAGENYDELEKSLQQHESEIRNHIRIEQQLKLYAESIQAKLDDSEKARSESTDQQKAIVSGLKKDNQRLADSFKQKSEEVEKLQATIKSLEEKNRDYETKLQNLPQLQERINHLEKRQRPPSAHGQSSQNLKETTSVPYGIENAKKIDVDFDYSKVNSKPDSARKSIKSIVGGSHPSPLRLVNKTFTNSNAQSATNKTKDTIRVKMEITDPKQRKDLETLKQSYQKFYNPTKSRERERGSNSVQRTRELKSIYSIPVVSNSSNISLIQFNNTNNLSQRDLTVTKLHQRSNSIGTANRHKVGNSFSRA